MGRLVGRDREVGAVEAFLENGETGARILVLEGEPGIGKTTVWRAAVAAALERGITVLASTAAESETQLSFTALRDLIDPAFDEIADALPGPQRQALAVTMLREEPPERSLELGTIAVGFTRALSVLAEERRVLLAVDDVQWLDAASTSVLAYALRRIHPNSFLALVARRPHQIDALGLEHLDRAWVEIIELGALSIGALGQILHEELGVAYPRPTLHRIARASDGNPFFALEVARALEQAPTSSLAGALPIPTSLRQLLRARLEALPGETLTALTYLSLMARPRLELLASALNRDPRSFLEPAFDASIIDVREGDARFTHPLLAAAAQDLASPELLRDIHRRLAAVLDDAEEQARHLALGAHPPDPGIAAVLEGSARRTDARGSRIVSAELYEAAARFTPASDVEDGARRELAAAAALFDAGDANRAAESIEALLAESAGGKGRVEAQLLLGRILADVGRWNDAMELWAEALDATDDSAAVADIRSSMAVMSIYGGSAADAIVHADEAVAAARKTESDKSRLAYAYAARAMAGVAAGDSSYRDFLRDALELSPKVDARTSAWDWSPTNAACACALHAFDIDEIRLRFGALFTRGMDSGNADLEQYGAYGLAQAELATGDPDRASELAEVVEQLAQETGVLRLPGATLRAEIDTHLGRADKARALLQAVISESDAIGKHRYAWKARTALGALHLAEGRPAEAAAELRTARELAEALGMRDPALVASLVDEAEAAAEANVLDQAEEALAAAQRLDTQPDWAPPLLLRARAIVAARRGDLDEAESRLTEGLTRPSALHLEQGRALLALGSVQRRLRHRAAARDTLEASLRAFEALGAELWAERAREEILRIGGRPPASGDLTPSELKIAALVAEGKKNREVAEALIITERTVESALTQIYRKLDVRSRTELARRLTAAH